MSDVIVSLIPFAIGSAAVPIFLIVFLLLLRSEGGLGRATAFVAGVTLVRLVQGALFAFVLPDSADGDGSNDPKTIASVIMMLLGLLLLVKGGQTLVNEKDPDAPPPKWMNSIETMSPAKAFLLGAGFLALSAKKWVFTIGALGVIKEGDLSTGGGAIAFVFYVVAAQALLFAALAGTALAPGPAATALARVSTLMERYNRWIVVTVSIVFGIYFLSTGLDGLRN